MRRGADEKAALRTLVDGAGTAFDSQVAVSSTASSKREPEHTAILLSFEELLRRTANGPCRDAR